MSKRAQPDFASISDIIPSSLKANGWIGQEITYVKPSELNVNTLNAKIFQRESDDYFRQLTEDIQKRGILVPLIAKRDNTLLAGHNRLEIAQQLGLKVVPVQYIEKDLSSDTEREFVIKDNLYRRHFSQSEWFAIYRVLYPDFDKQILEENRGGDRKSKSASPLGVLQPKLTSERIAADTGQKATAVKQQLNKYRKELRNASESESKGKQKIKSISHTFDSERPQKKKSNDEVTITVQRNPSGEVVLYQLVGRGERAESGAIGTYYDETVYASQKEAEENKSTFKKSLTKKQSGNIEMDDSFRNNARLTIIVKEVRFVGQKG